MSLVTAVEVPRRSASLLEPIIGESRYLRLVQAADQVRQLLAGRTIWNVNSTATGGGVAEMLLRSSPLASDVHLDEVALRTPGFVVADLLASVPF